MTISYRQARVDDAPAIDRVFRESFCDTFAHLYRPEDLEAFLSAFTLDAWRSELGDERFAFRVAEADRQVVGYVKLGRRRFRSRRKAHPSSCGNFTC